MVMVVVVVVVVVVREKKDEGGGVKISDQKKCAKGSQGKSRKTKVMTTVFEKTKGSTTKRGRVHLMIYPRSFALIVISDYRVSISSIVRAYLREKKRLCIYLVGC